MGHRTLSWEAVCFVLASGFVLAGASSLSADLKEPAPADNPAPSAEMAALIAAHNRERASEKLPPLVANAKLMAAALVQARDMAEHNKLSHEGSDGSKFNERIERQGYQGRRLGENVAMGQKTVADVMRGWMKSPHHRENILGEYDAIGAARVNSDNGMLYWCVNFGLSRPHVDPDTATLAVIEALNRAREKAGKPPLKPNAKLASAAHEVAQEQAKQGKLAPGEASLDDLVRKTGYRFRALGEAAALGQLSAEEVARTWVESDTTRQTFLGTFSDIGVGCVTSDKGIPFWAVFLAQPAQ